MQRTRTAVVETNGIPEKLDFKYNLSSFRAKAIKPTPVENDYFRFIIFL